MAIKITKPSRENIVQKMVEVFKKHGVLDNVSIVYNNQMISFGEMDLSLQENPDDDVELIFDDEPIITPNKKSEDYGGNKNTLVVMYDGGALCSCMNREFGYHWRDELEKDLELVFGPYHLAIEEIDNVSFTLAEGVEPEYETVMNKLKEN